MSDPFCCTGNCQQGKKCPLAEPYAFGAWVDSLSPAQTRLLAVLAIAGTAAGVRFVAEVAWRVLG